MKVTADELKAAVLASGIKRIPLRECSICNAPLSYLVVDENIFFDGNCDCGYYRSEPRQHSWHHVARNINIQPSIEGRNRMRAKFFLTPEVESGK